MPAIIDGLRLHPGHRYVFKHNDLDDCEKQLQRATALIENRGAGGILVITEGVFGMAGDQGKLKEIAALKKKYSFRLLVDDAHGFGTLGKQEPAPVKNRAARTRSTCTSPPLPIDGIHRRLHCRRPPDHRLHPLQHPLADIRQSLPMPLVVASLKRLELLRNHPEFKEKLWSNAMKLQKGLKTAALISAKPTPWLHRYT